jgi:putative membrane protein
MKNIALLFLLSVLFLACNPDRRDGAENTETEIVAGHQVQIDRESIEDMVIYTMINNRLHVALAEQLNEDNLHPEVQILRDRILNEYEDYQYNLNLLATNYDIEIPQGITLLAQEKFDRITGLSPENFRDEFVNLLIKNHQEDLSRFEAILVQDGDIMERGIIESMHNTLGEHLALAERLNDDET